MKPHLFTILIEMHPKFNKYLHIGEMKYCCLFGVVACPIQVPNPFFDTFLFTTLPSGGFKVKHVLWKKRCIPGLVKPSAQLYLKSKRRICLTR